MKYKFLIPIALSIVIGLFFGKVFFDNYNSSSLTVFDEKDKEIASRIKDYYEKNGYSIYIKENILDNESFLSILGEYDKIIGITGDNDLQEVEKIVISNYKEMVLESEA